MRRLLAFGLLCAGIPLNFEIARAQDETAGNEIPPAFAPFEHMIGSWKGMAIPSANRLKGWPETHMWAWKFSKGAAVGMSLELKGDTVLSKGQLLYNPGDRTYRLEGTGSDGKPIVFVGTIDKAGKALVLDRVGQTSDGKERVTIRPNSNHIRYQLLFDRAEPGAPQYKTVVEIGLTKEGESFAAGGSVNDLPKCIVTGGAATLNVTYEGKSYPLCCTGCRDEFNENPAKYVKKALLRSQAGTKSPVKPVSRGKADDEFDGLVDEPKTGKTMPAPKSAPGSTASKEKPQDSDEDDSEAKNGDPTSKKSSGKASRAASLLSQARALEKSRKSAAALGYYKRIVKEYPGTEQAKAAAARIKAIGK